MHTAIWHRPACFTLSQIVSCTLPSTMPWYTPIAQFLGWYQKDLQINSTGAAIIRRPDNIMDRLRALFLFRSMRWFLPPLDDKPPVENEDVSTIQLTAILSNAFSGQGGISISTTIETDTEISSHDDIVAMYHGYRIASFWIPPQRYNRKKATIDVHCRATVYLDHYDFLGYRRIPSSEKEMITVFFMHEQWRVWVTMPYTYAKSKLRLQHDRSNLTLSV
jgi:hypothetical protein